MASTTITRDDVREDQVTAPAAPAWETVSFDPGAKRRPTVTDADGRVRELTDFEFSRWEASKEDTAMRRQAAAAQAGTGTLTAQMKARPRVVQGIDENTVYGFQLSPSIHEERVLSLTTGEDDEVRGYLTDASSFFQSTRETLVKIDTAYKALMLDKSIPPDERVKRLEEQVGKAFTTAYTARGKALDAISKKIEHTSSLLDKPLEVQAATERSKELRAVLREMKRDERNTLIRSAIQAEKPSAAQREILDSVLGANHIVTGVTEVEQGLMIRQFNERTQPTLLRRLDLLKKTHTMIESLEVKTLTDQFQGALRSPFTRASNIRGISDAAQKALLAINGG
jgi:hypothetical protein